MSSSAAASAPDNNEQNLGLSEQMTTRVQLAGVVGNFFDQDPVGTFANILSAFFFGNIAMLVWRRFSGGSVGVDDVGP